MGVKLSRAIPKWLTIPGLLMFTLSLLAGTLVYAARQQPADDQQCLKIAPSSGDFSYVYVDANNGTRLNMPAHDLNAISYEQISQAMPSPDDRSEAMLIGSTTAPISKISLESLITGSRITRPMDAQYPGIIEWSSDSKYLAVSSPGTPQNGGELAVLSGHDLSDVVRISASVVTGIWAAHSNSLAFIEQRPDRKYWLSILIVDSDGKVTRLPGVIVPDVNEGSYLLQWSPDDQYVAISTSDFGGVVSSDGGEYQVVSDHGGTEEWIPDTVSLAFMDVDAMSNLAVYDPVTRTTKTLSTGVVTIESSFSPDGRYAILSHVGSLPELRVYSIMNLATGAETELAKSTSLNEVLNGNVHWSIDNQTVVLVLPDKVVWADVHDLLHILVHESPIALIDQWDFLADNSWMQFEWLVGPIAGVTQLLNPPTGDHYQWKHADSPKDVFVNYWPNNLIVNMQYDAVRGSIKRVTLEDPFATVDLDSGPIPWLANTKYLVSVGSDPNAIVPANSIVHIRRLDGTSLWTLHDVGNLRDDPDSIRWLNCSRVAGG